EAARAMAARDIIEFLLKAMSLIHKAMIARDLSEKGISRKSNASVIARQVNAAGGPLMDPTELNDETCTLGRMCIMTTYHEETDALPCAQREPEPPLLKFLRRRRVEVIRLYGLAHNALARPHGRDRRDALENIERRLDNLNSAMAEDIYLAEID